MRWFHLSIGGETLGPCTFEEVVGHVEAGRADGETPYWEEGMADWEPLARLIPDLGVPPAAATAPVVPVPAPVGGEPRLTVTAARARFAEQARRDRAGWRALVIGWLFVFAALVAALFHGSPLLVGIGLFAVVAAAVASFAALANRKVFGGLVLLAAAAVLPYLLFAWAKRNQLTPFGVTFGTAADSAADSRSVAFLDATFTRGNGEMILEGRLHNQAGRPLDNLQVTVEWLDAAGLQVGESAAIVHEGGTVQPDQAVPFRVVAPDDPAVTKYRSFVEFADTERTASPRP